jgi:small subunit ribosomal protein S20
MPQHVSSVKRVRQDIKRRLHNRTLKANLRDAIKAVLKATDKATGEPALTKAVSYIDRMVNKNILHRNNAAHKKARLVTYVNNLP